MSSEGARTFEPPRYVRGIQLLEACIQKLHDEYGATYEDLEPLVETAIEQGLLWPASGFDENTALPSSDFKVQSCARCGELGWYSDIAEVCPSDREGLLDGEGLLVHESTCVLPDDQLLTDAATGDRLNAGCS